MESEYGKEHKIIQEMKKLIIVTCLFLFFSCGKDEKETEVYVIQKTRIPEHITTMMIAYGKTTTYQPQVIPEIYQITVQYTETKTVNVSQKEFDSLNVGQKIKLKIAK